MVGATDCALEDKMVTIAYGIDMVNISYISFAATTKAIAQVGPTNYISQRFLLFGKKLTVVALLLPPVMTA